MTSKSWFFALVLLAGSAAPLAHANAAPRVASIVVAKAGKAKKKSSSVKQEGNKKPAAKWPWFLGFVVLGGAGVGYWKRREIGAFVAAKTSDGIGSKIKGHAKDLAKSVGHEVAKKAVSAGAKIGGDAVQSGVGGGLGGAIAGDVAEFGLKKSGHAAVEKKVKPATSSSPVGVSTLTPRPIASSPASPVAKAAPAAKAPAAKAAGHGYPPVNGIDIKSYAKINAERNRTGAFDDEALGKILKPHGIGVTEFAEVEQVWQTRMADGSQPPEKLRALMDEFNAASAAAMQAAA